MSVDMSERMSDRVLRDMSKRMSERTHKICPKKCQNIFEKECHSEDVFQRMSDRMSGDLQRMSEGMPEDYLQPVCEVESSRN